MSTGSVVVSARARKPVAPNSPSAITKANPPAAPRLPPMVGTSMVRNTATATPADHRCLTQPGWHRRERRQQHRITNGTAMSACTRDYQRRVRHPRGKLSQRDQVPEAQGHRTDAQRNHRQHIADDRDHARRPVQRDRP